MNYVNDQNKENNSFKYYKFFIYAIVTILGATILLLNGEFFIGLKNGVNFSSKHIYVLVLLNLIINTVCFFLIILFKIPKLVPDEPLKRFIGMAKERDRINFSTLTIFLGEQALCAFLATLIIFNGKDIYVEYGPIITACYHFTMYIATMIIMSLSAIKFMSYFMYKGFI